MKINSIYQKDEMTSPWVFPQWIALLSLKLNFCYMVFESLKLAVGACISRVKLKVLNAFAFRLLLPWDTGAHSGEFIYGLENFVYKDIKPGGYAWLIIFNFIKILFFTHAWDVSGVHLVVRHALKIWKCNSRSHPCIPFLFPTVWSHSFIHWLFGCFHVASPIMGAWCFNRHSSLPLWSPQFGLQITKICIAFLL